MKHPHRPTEHTPPRYPIQFGAYDAEADLHPQVLAYGLRLYAEVRQAYEASGCPLGGSDEAMLVWFTFGDPEGNNEAVGSSEPAATQN